MERVNYKVKIPYEIIVRGNKFIENHPGVEIEDYLRAQVVLYSTRSSNFLGADLDEEESAGKEMLFSFNLSFEKSLKKTLKERFMIGGHYIRDACICIDKDVIESNKGTIRILNLILKAI